MSKAVIVFSGGQDSTTVLGKALLDGFECFPISFDYGQKHGIELTQAARIIDRLRGGDHGSRWAASVQPRLLMPMRDFGQLVAPKSALLNNGQNVSEKSVLSDELPASFVPNRNAMMLTIAHAYAQVVGADTIWTGVCQTDYSGYPDCRREFIQALAYALNTGYKTNISIITPLMDLTKAETFKLADECGILDLVIEESHTCYNGVRSHGDIPTNPPEGSGGGFYDWGHGCGECPACALRAKGWEEFKSMKRIG